MLLNFINGGEDGRMAFEFKLSTDEIREKMFDFIKPVYKNVWDSEVDYINWIYGVYDSETGFFISIISGIILLAKSTIKIPLQILIAICLMRKCVEYEEKNIGILSLKFLPMVIS